MDEAELWLERNDPTYASSSKAWQHVAGADYRLPRAERPWQDGEKLEELITDTQMFLDHGALPELSRLCRVCDRPFEPRSAAQALCTDECRDIDRRRYMRDLMRQRRQAA